MAWLMKNAIDNVQYAAPTTTCLLITAGNRFKQTILWCRRPQCVPRQSLTLSDEGDSIGWDNRALPVRSPRRYDSNDHPHQHERDSLSVTAGVKERRCEQVRHVEDDSADDSQAQVTTCHVNEHSTDEQEVGAEDVG